MKLSVFDPIVSYMGLEEMLQYLSPLGVQAMEIGAGGTPGDAHLKPAEYFENPAKVKETKDLFKKYNMEICAISCHGNPVHPNKEIATMYHEQFENAIRAAEMLEVDTIIGFAGCPGDCPTSQYPNWVTCTWPEDYPKVLNWQWNEVVIPYWQKEAEFAKAHGIKHIAFEMHPGFVVYNPETTLKLRAAIGDIIGANFDPSHLFWQGIEPTAAIRALKGAIYHFHAKDTRIDEINSHVNGNLDTKSFERLADRSWIFRTVGYGHGKEVWNDIISTLRMVGYDGAISIEHEDGLMSPTEGLEKAIKFLNEVLIHEQAGEMFWA